MLKRASIPSALVYGLSMIVLAQANGDPGAASNGSAKAESHEVASGGNAMERGRSGNSGPDAKAMGGSNALSGTGQKKKQP